MKIQDSTSFKSSPSTKQFYIENLGCFKNQVDAEVLIAALGESGWKYTEDPEDAEVLLINSCGFIRSAKEESIRAFLDLKRRYSGKRVLLTGCLSQRYGKDLAGQLPEAEAVFGNRGPQEVVDFLHSFQKDRAKDRAEAGRESEAERIHTSSGPPYLERKVLLSYPGSAYIKISEGCNNRCSYCAIPLIRGPLRSREADEVINEAAGLLNRGVKEIILIAQDLGSYGMDKNGPSGSQVEGIPKSPLARLLHRFKNLPGDFWLRLLYIHPDNFPRDILPIIAAEPRFLPYFDIPFQHGDAGVLSRMGRRGDAAAYLALVKEIRETCPEAIIRSTFMTAFPGEGRKEFQALLNFQKDAQLDWVGFFVYSREEDTPAYRMRGRLSDFFAERWGERRKKALQEIQSEITTRRLNRFVGRTIDVLIEEKVEGTELFLGRGYPQAPEVDGLIVVGGEDLLPGEIVPVEIQGVQGVDMRGRVLLQGTGERKGERKGRQEHG